MNESPVARAAQAIAAHAPQYRETGLRPLGAGLDHQVFVADDLVVRVREAGDHAGVAHEADLLKLVGARVSIPVPVPVFVDAVRGVLGHRLVPGQRLLGRTPPGDAAPLLGVMLRELHGIDRTLVGDIVPVDPAEPDEWLDELTGPPALVRTLRATRPRPARSLVLAHADLGAEHILESGGRLTGIIDWSDAAVTDPALDFARLYRDFGPSFLDAALDAYGHDSPDLRTRITFFARCAALEDIAYGRETGQEEYVRAAERSLSWLFPGTPSQVAE